MKNDLLQSFMPHRTPVSLAEKFRSGMVGGIAILLLGAMLHFLPHAHYPLLMLGSIAASAVLLFAAPHSPMAQPWNLLAGHLFSAMAGWCCSLIIDDQVLAAATAVGTSILVMHLLDCLHPPGAATALTMVLGSAQYQDMGWIWMLYIVAANAGLSLILALAINNMLPGRTYPMRAGASAPPKPGPFISLEQHDLAWALAQMEEVIDVCEEDLAKIYELALRHAQERNEAVNPPQGKSA